MNNTRRIRIAALSTALFLGGITAGGLGMRAINESPAPKTVTVTPRTQVIRQTKVRTIHIKPKKPKRAPSPPVAASTAAAAAQPVAAQTQPAVVQSPTKVTSRTSSTGSGGGGGEGEHDGGGEHEGGGDD
jgi:hypothetical protein